MLKKVVKKDNIFLLVLFAISVFLAFVKQYYISTTFQLNEFGKYSLYLTYGTFFSYFFNFGLYEGSLVVCSERKSEKTNFSEILNNIFSVVFFISICCVLLVLFIYFIFRNSNLQLLICSSLLSAITITQFNLLTVPFRVFNRLYIVSWLLIIKNFVSFLLYYFLRIGSFKLEEAFFLEGILFFAIATIIVLINFLFYKPRFNLSFLPFIKNGFFNMLTSATKSSFYSLDRFLASFSMSFTTLGIYSKALLVNNLFVVFGGLFTQIFQQKLIDKHLYDKAFDKFKLIKLQILLVVVLSIIICSTLLSFNFFERFLLDYIGIDRFSLCLIIIAGIINGLNIFDSLFLLSKSKYKLFLITIYSILFYLISWFFLKKYFKIWDLNIQIFLFFFYSVIYFILNCKFFYNDGKQ